MDCPREGHTLSADSEDTFDNNDRKRERLIAITERDGHSFAIIVFWPVSKSSRIVQRYDTL